MEDFFIFGAEKSAVSSKIREEKKIPQRTLSFLLLSFYKKKRKVRKALC
ncbi:hypothetical protein C8C83_3688 [Flavobacterium sp. 90]|nr:hypothetical protein C8C82_4007 [Flavobacterium sp. 81]TCK55704.1 hypothetical protein C8C83_3688 [Flavobacterium sp. 90]